jgi:cytochrome c2
VQDLHGGVIYKPTTAVTFPGLRSEKDIDDVIAYITGNQGAGQRLGVTNE